MPESDFFMVFWTAAYGIVSTAAVCGAVEVGRALGVKQGRAERVKREMGEGL